MEGIRDTGLWLCNSHFRSRTLKTTLCLHVRYCGTEKVRRNKRDTQKINLLLFYISDRDMRKKIYFRYFHLDLIDLIVENSVYFLEIRRGTLYGEEVKERVEV